MEEIRAELRNASVRDVIDFLDYDIEPNVWIERYCVKYRPGAMRLTLHFDSPSRSHPASNPF
jgi:hypothetical protein